MNLNLKQKYLILMSVSILIFMVLRIPYRNYIYDNHLWDFYIADTSPNFFAVLMFVFYKKWKSTTSDSLLISSGAFFGLLIYEYLIQIHIYDATIDHLDVIASLFGAVTAYSICRLLNNTHLN